MTNIGYGIDLSGYSMGKTRVARAERKANGHVSVTLLSDGVDVDDVKCTGETELHEAAATLQKNLLNWLVEEGAVVAVDIPIDLQGLPVPTNPKYIWELTQRPVDRAFGGLSPLASLLGAPVARFQNLLTGEIGKTIMDRLGKTLFETYPAATLGELGIVNKGYKGGRITAHKDGWIGKSDNKEKNHALKQIAVSLNLKCTKIDGCPELSDDHIDAIICALTAIAPEACRLCTSDDDGKFAKTISDKINRDRDVSLPLYEAPCGYRIIDSNLPWSDIQVYIDG